MCFPLVEQCWKSTSAFYEACMFKTTASADMKNNTSYSDTCAIKAGLAIRIPSVWKLFHLLMVVFLRLFTPPKNLVGVFMGWLPR